MSGQSNLSTTAEFVKRNTQEESAHTHASTAREMVISRRNVGKRLENQATKRNKEKGKGARAQTVDQANQREPKSDTKRKKMIANLKSKRFNNRMKQPTGNQHNLIQNTRNHRQKKQRNTLPRK